jgi:hypothetical protein
LGEYVNDEGRDCSSRGLRITYLFVYDVASLRADKLAKAVNILAKEVGYKVVNYSRVSSDGYCVCMIKEEEWGGE